VCLPVWVPTVAHKAHEHRNLSVVVGGGGGGTAVAASLGFCVRRDKLRGGTKKVKKKGDSCFFSAISRESVVVTTVIAIGLLALYVYRRAQIVLRLVRLMALTSLPSYEFYMFLLSSKYKVDNTNLELLSGAQGGELLAAKGSFLSGLGDSAGAGRAFAGAALLGQGRDGRTWRLWGEHCEETAGAAFAQVK